jgi:acyl-CoA synthetase (AMP-forming)/AMP-acid ligase II
VHRVKSGKGGTVVNSLKLYDEKTISGSVLNNGRRYPNKVYVISRYQDGRRTPPEQGWHSLTWGQMDAMTRNLLQGLYTLGGKEGDRLAVF